MFFEYILFFCFGEDNVHILFGKGTRLIFFRILLVILRRRVIARLVLEGEEKIFYQSFNPLLALLQLLNACERIIWRWIARWWLRTCSQDIHPSRLERRNYPGD